MIEISSNWPTWLIALGIVLNGALSTFLIFKTQIGTSLLKSVSGLFRLRAKGQDHTQTIEEAVVNARLQTNATQELREAWREEQYLELIRVFFTKDVQEIKDGVAGLREDVRANTEAQKTATGQTNNLLNQIHIALSRRG